MPYQKGTGQHRYKNIIGMRFGRLIAKEFVGTTKDKYALWRCLCDCGNTKIVAQRNLRDGFTKSCGCLQREVVANMLRKGTGVASFNSLWASYKNGAHNRGLDFNLTKDEFMELTKQNCYYCGQEPSQSFGQSKSNGYYIYNGIDRLDPKVGYVIDNCVPACVSCNMAKQGLTEKQFLALVEKIYNFQNGVKIASKIF